MELARPFCCSVAGRVGRDCDGDEVRRLTVSLDVISEVLPLLRKTSSKVEDFVVSGCGCVVGAWEKCTATYEGRCTGLRSLVLGLRRHGGEVESCAVEEYPKQTNKNDCAVSTYQRAGMFLHLLFGH